MVVRGASGSGKTTLFRVLAGLWPFGRGRVAHAPGCARLLPAAETLPAAWHAEGGAELSGAPEHYTEAKCREVLEACGLPHLVRASVKPTTGR